MAGSLTEDQLGKKKKKYSIHVYAKNKEGYSAMKQINISNNFTPQVTPASTQINLMCP